MRKPHPTPADDRIDAKISQLRKLLLSAKDLDEVSEYFHNVLVPDDAFIVAGARGSNARLLTALQAVLERVAPEGKLGTPLSIRLQQQAFCHGYTTWGAGHAVFFYFEQLDLGFCSYSRSLSSAEVTFLRFNLTNAAGAATWATWPTVNPAVRKTPQ
ncbi:MAG TPA: hypothetical protein VJV79_29655 [Polyangiaceae bacterium]|nr:hypothetical protein [Polyangiaceae bacterium]